MARAWLTGGLGKHLDTAARFHVAALCGALTIVLVRVADRAEGGAEKSMSS